MHQKMNHHYSNAESFIIYLQSYWLCHLIETAREAAEIVWVDLVVFG